MAHIRFMGIFTLQFFFFISCVRIIADVCIVEDTNDCSIE